MFSPPELVIFDLDNTLYDFGIANCAGELALREFLHENLMISQEEIKNYFDASRTRVKATLGKTASSHSRLMYIRDFLNSNNFSVHATFALECEQVYWRGYLNETKLFDGVNEFISYLRLSKIKVVLVSDLSTQIQLKKLAWLGLENSFELIVTSEEAGGDKETGKPESMLRRFLDPVVGGTWAIGDQDWDHLFPSESIFFKKTISGKLKKKSKSQIEFCNFRELLANIDVKR